MGYPTTDPMPRFAAKYRVDEQTGCWIWLGARNVNGYGNFGMGGRRSTIGAHRASWILHRGPVPNGVYVCHHCDTPACVNPDHLFLGPPKANQLDMVTKGRARYGRRAKLTYADAQEIRRLRREGVLLRDLAARYGVSEAAISMAANAVTFSTDHRSIERQ